MASSTNQQFTEAVDEARKQAEQGERQRKQSPSAMKAQPPHVRERSSSEAASAAFCSRTA